VIDGRRTSPPATANEFEMLDAFLEYQQKTLLLKIEGLTREQLDHPMVPSGMTLLGMVKHLAYAYQWWLQVAFMGRELPRPWTNDDPDAEFRIEPGESVSDIENLYLQEVAAAREVARSSSLDDRAVKPHFRPSLRWIMVHLIEETARHNGHADIFREQIDGQTGE
jgi:uncharacterized damage-inducible protein DinB